MNTIRVTKWLYIVVFFFFVILALTFMLSEGDTPVVINLPHRLARVDELPHSTWNHEEKSTRREQSTGEERRTLKEHKIWKFYLNYIDNYWTKGFGDVRRRALEEAANRPTVFVDEPIKNVLPHFTRITMNMEKTTRRQTWAEVSSTTKLTILDEFLKFAEDYWTRSFRNEQRRRAIAEVSANRPTVFVDGMSINLTRVRLEMSLLEEMGAGCTIPKLDPYADEVVKMIKDVPDIKCEGEDWVYCYTTGCYVTQPILDTMTDIACVYRDIIYVDDNKYVFGEPIKKYGNEIYRLNKSDHVKIACSGRTTHGSLLKHIIPSRWSGNKAGFRPIPPKPTRKRKENYDVLIVAFEGATHNGFLRRMPKVYHYLSNVMNATVFKGYSIVGDGNPALLFPLLSGRSELELPDSKIQSNSSKNTKLRHKDFIFRLMGNYGYRTAFFEDMPWIGTFQHLYNGFDQQPADHYIRPFLLEESDNGTKWWRGIKERHCMGSTLTYDWMMHLTDRFFTLKGRHFCFTMIKDICHNDFNMISAAETDFLDFLIRFVENKRHNNTLLIVTGSHGKSRETRENYQTKMENRLPYLAISLPEDLKKARPSAVEALKSNINRLTTPFDVHATILDAVGLKSKWNKYRIPGSNNTRALSLLEPIPITRVCGEAGILPHWCVCAKWQYVSSADAIYHRIGHTLAEFIIKLTDGMRHLYRLHRSQCLLQKLIWIEWVKVHRPHEDLLRYQGSIDHDALINKFGRQTMPLHYYARIVMDPGKSVFECALKYDTRTRNFTVSDSDIIRPNHVTKESLCVLHTYPYLAKYCYCKEYFSLSANELY